MLIPATTKYGGGAVGGRRYQHVFVFTLIADSHWLREASQMFGSSSARHVEVSPDSPPFKLKSCSLQARAVDTSATFVSHRYLWKAFLGVDKKVKISIFKYEVWQQPVR